MQDLAIVTATADPIQSQECRTSWGLKAKTNTRSYVVVNGCGDPEIADGWTETAFGTWVYGSRDFLGVVPAFALGVQKALDTGAQIIACLHDDLQVDQDGWDLAVQRIFKTCPKAGLVGFGGALGLGDPQIYQKPYDPMQLARRGFLSNMRDAEAHGSRTTSAQPVAVLDGFSQIGKREFWQGWHRDSSARLYEADRPESSLHQGWNLFSLMQSWGLVHHAYDAALGCFAKRLGYQVWLAPIACHHYGGRTAVGNQAYQQWAQSQVANGDQGFWNEAHRIVYDQFRGVLPIN